MCHFLFVLVTKSRCPTQVKKECVFIWINNNLHINLWTWHDCTKMWKILGTCTEHELIRAVDHGPKPISAKTKKEKEIKPSTQLLFANIPWRSTLHLGVIVICPTPTALKTAHMASWHAIVSATMAYAGQLAVQMLQRKKDQCDNKIISVKQNKTPATKPKNRAHCKTLLPWKKCPRSLSCFNTHSVHQLNQTIKNLYPKRKYQTLTMIFQMPS